LLIDMNRQIRERGRQDTQPADVQKRSRRGCLIGSVIFLGVVIIAATIFLWQVLPFMNQPLGDPLNLPGGETASTQESGLPKNTPEVIQTENSAPPICGDVRELTLLLIGTDFRGSGYLYGLADVIRIIHIDFTIPQVNMVALPRALLIQVPGPDLDVETPILINQAYLFGTQGMGHFSGSGYGAGALAETIQTNFGITVDNYLVVNFKAFVNFIDRIGSIQVDLPKAIDAEPAAFFPAGEQWLNGEEALILARNRKNSSDNARIDIQSLIIEGILNRFSDPSIILDLPGLFSEFTSAVLTDVTPSQIQTAVCMIGKLNAASIQYFNPSTDIMPYGKEFIPTVNKEMDVFHWDQTLVDWIHQSLYSKPE
jgi:LCP family protein required for cell wall assembly